jgi:hypothetical protein
MIDPGKNYTTRDGFAVRIVATDAKGRFPIVGLVDMVNAEYARHWTAEGKADLRRNVTTNYDLVEKE